MDWPPLVAAAYDAVERLDAEQPGILRDGSAAVELAIRRLREGVWTAWHSEQAPAWPGPSTPALPGMLDQFSDPATQRVLQHLDRERHDLDPAAAEQLLDRTGEVAYYTGLPSASVARALTDIEAALPARLDAGEPPPEPVPPPAHGPASPVATREEDRLALALRILGFVMALWAVAIGAALENEGSSALAVVSGIMRCALIAVLCAVTGSDVRRFAPLTQVVVGAFFLESAIAALLLVGGAEGSVELLAVTTQADLFLLLLLACDLSIAAVLGWLWHTAYKRRWGLEFLSPGRHRTVAALSEAIEGTAARVPPEDVALNVDRYLTRAPKDPKARARAALTGVAFWPLTRGRATFSLLPVRERARIARRLLSSTHGTLTAPLQASLRISHQLCALGYYSDPRAAAEVGVANADEPVSAPQRTNPRIRTLAPDQALRHSVDAVVVGSGAAGAVIAYRLAELGLRTLIVERGREVDPSRTASAGLQTLPDLFADGGVGLIKDFDRRVIQASCIGGGTSIGPATWQAVSPLVMDRWSRPDMDAGLDPDRFRAAWDRVQRWIPGSERPEGRISRGAELLAAGMRSRGYDAPALRPSDDELTFGITAPLSERSHAVLDTLLPWAQKRFGDRLLILPGCEAQRIRVHRAAPRAVECRLDGRKLTIDAPLVAVAGGAIGSTQLLKRSDVGRGVGRRFSFDLSTTLTADFAETIDAHIGVQLLTDVDPSERTFVVETVWPDLWLQAVAMPGMFDQHAANMHRYRHMAAARVHLGIDQKSATWLPTYRRPTNVKLDAPELGALAKRVSAVGSMWLDAGALRVIPAALHYREYRTEPELKLLEEHARSPGELSVIVRPQGGAQISRDPRRGVVDPQLRLHGHRNLFVCDASVFPTSVARAPRITAMAIAEYAAEGIE